MNNLKKKNYIITLILVFILGAGSCFGFLYFSGAGKNILNENNSRYARLPEMEEFLKANFYKEITDSAINTGLYRGLFSAADDPYTVYYTKEEFEQVSGEAHGENSGIGVVMKGSEDGSPIEIIQIIEGAPAEASGMKEGDRLISVDGEEFTGTQTVEAAAKARGEAGTEVEIKINRNGKEHVFNIIRENFINPSVSAELIDDNIGYIWISAFNDNTANDFKEELNNFEDQKVKGLIIDLRNNVGGIVTQGVEIADLLLDEADLAYAMNNRDEKQVYSTKDGKTDLPYVLLVNENTASTSEILAVGVKENNGGPLVGTTTFGKGLIQKLQQFRDGDGVRITIMQYFSASGQPINDVGVEPDYKVKEDPESGKDVQLEKAKNLLN